MIYLKKTIKYFLCVVIATICSIMFGFIFSNGSRVFLTENILYDIPIYLGFGWMLYQFLVNRIHKQDLYYYWMIIKVTIQSMTIVLGGVFIMLYLTK